MVECMTSPAAGRDTWRTKRPRSEPGPRSAMTGVGGSNAVASRCRRGLAGPRCRPRRGSLRRRRPVAGPRCRPRRGSLRRRRPVAGPRCRPRRGSLAPPATRRWPSVSSSSGPPPPATRRWPSVSSSSGIAPPPATRRWPSVSSSSGIAPPPGTFRWPSVSSSPMGISLLYVTLRPEEPLQRD